MREGQPSTAATIGVVILLLLIAGGSLLLDWAERRYRPAPAQRTEILVPPPPSLRPDATLVSDPRLLAPLTPEQARARNAAIAPSSEPADPARPFQHGGVAGSDMARAMDCLTAAVYYEAASESDQGQRAVAQVVLNRVRHTAFPHTVCGVVFQGAERQTGCQFSFTCDGALRRAPSPRGWARARIAAAMVYNGYVERSVGLATHYHTVSVLPYWSPKLVKLTTLGAHVFLRWPGDWGRPVAFGTRYAGKEPLVGEAAATLVTDAAEGEVLTNVVGAATPLPQTWDRPLLRPGAPVDAQGDDAPVVGMGERRILGIDPPPAAADRQPPSAEPPPR